MFYSLYTRIKQEITNSNYVNNIFFQILHTIKSLVTNFTNFFSSLSSLVFQIIKTSRYNSDQIGVIRYEYKKNNLNILFYIILSIIQNFICTTNNIK